MLKDFVVILLSTVSLIACSSTEIYSEVARELIEHDEVNGLGHEGIWLPIGEESRPATNGELLAASADQSTCTERLQEGRSTAFTKRKSVAAAQLIDCMNNEGWALVIIQTITLRH